jgi:hypothetical protein
MDAFLIEYSDEVRWPQTDDEVGRIRDGFYSKFVRLLLYFIPKFILL